MTDAIADNILALVGTEETYKINAGDSEGFVANKKLGLARSARARELLADPEAIDETKAQELAKLVWDGLDYQSGFTMTQYQITKDPKMTADAKTKILSDAYNRMPDSTLDAYRSLAGAKAEKNLYQTFIHAADTGLWSGNQEKTRAVDTLSDIRTAITTWAGNVRQKTITDKLPVDIEAIVGKEQLDAAVKDAAAIIRGENDPKKAKAQLDKLIENGLGLTPEGGGDPTKLEVTFKNAITAAKAMANDPEFVTKLDRAYITGNDQKIVEEVEAAILTTVKPLATPSAPPPKVPAMPDHK